MRLGKPFLLLGLGIGMLGLAPAVWAQDDVPTTTAVENTTGTQMQTAAASDTTSVTLVPGVVIQDLQVGAGEEAVKNKEVAVHYTLTLASGKIIDSSRTRIVPRPFKFTTGKGFVVKGFDRGVEGMKVGGRRIIAVAPEMGYGSRNPRIPSTAWLYFDVELLAVKDPPSGVN